MLQLTTDKHEASRGFSVTAELKLHARSDKSVCYVTNNKRLYSMFCTVEANYTDRHETSRGLFATAELLVLCNYI